MNLAVKVGTAAGRARLGGDGLRHEKARGQRQAKTDYDELSITVDNNSLKHCSNLVLWYLGESALARKGSVNNYERYHYCKK